jgi:ribosomal protein S18 acetylase RimI-like enzyme
MTGHDDAVGGPSRPEVPSMAVLLARAFHDDPMMAWVVPDPAARPRALAAFFAANLSDALRHGRVDTSPAGDAAAIWLAPGAFRMSVWRMLRSGHALLPFRMGAAPWRRLQRLNAYALMQHARTVAGPHWYLYGVGVEPGSRGRGVGTALLRPALERADHARLPCYLETSNPRTLPLYERLGFRVAIPGRVPPDGPPYWALLRPGRR